MVHTIQLATAGKLTGGGEPSNATVKAGAGTHPTFNVDILLQGGGQLLLEESRDNISTKLSGDFVPHPCLCEHQHFTSWRPPFSRASFFNSSCRICLLSSHITSLESTGFRSGVGWSWPWRLLKIRARDRGRIPPSLMVPGGMWKVDSCSKCCSPTQSIKRQRQSAVLWGLLLTLNCVGFPWVGDSICIDEPVLSFKYILDHLLHSQVEETFLAHFWPKDLETHPISQRPILRFPLFSVQSQ